MAETYSAEIAATWRPILVPPTAVSSSATMTMEWPSDVAAGLVLSDVMTAGLMTRNPTTVTPATPLLEAMRVLVRDGVHCLPVVDARHAVVGIVTDTDLLRAFIELCTGAASS